MTDERDAHKSRRWRTREYGSFRLAVDGGALVFHTQPGVFSHDGPDEGTLLLLEIIRPELRPHQIVLDLGCGVGVIGLSVASALARGEVWLVDSDVRATRLGESNRERNGIENAHVLLSDITLDLPDVKFDLVLSNPPTHSGKEVLAHFVGESYEVLRPGGRLFFVVNRLLSVRDMMDEVFGNAEQVARRKGFLVLKSEKVRRAAGTH